jgi:hypothetical protein
MQEHAFFRGLLVTSADPCHEGTYVEGLRRVDEVCIEQSCRRSRWGRSTLPQAEFHLESCMFAT